MGEVVGLQSFALFLFNQMATDKKSFLLYCDIQHTIKKLSDEQAGKLFKHILSYVNDESPATDDMIIDLVFEPIKQQLKRDLKVYNNRCQANKINGKLGGRPNPNKPKEPTGLLSNPNNPNGSVNNPNNPNGADNDIDNDNGIDNVIIKRGFKKPTLEEVKDYCKDKGVDPIKWFNHYESNGWKVGKNPMKNWKAAIATWQKQTFTIQPKPVNDPDAERRAEILASFEKQMSR